MEQLLHEIWVVLQPTLLTIITIVIGYLGKRANDFIQSKITLQDQAKIDNIIKASVVWVEQISGVNLGLEAHDKLRLAKERALTLLNQSSFEVSEEYLDTLIEMFVNELHWNKGEIK